MHDLYKLPDLKDTTLCWLPTLRRSGFTIYWLAIGLFLTGFLSLFFIKVDISVRATGIIRPFNERAEIHSPAGGIIDRIYFKDGELVLKNNILIAIRDPALAEKQHVNESEITRCKDFIHDLELLTAATLKDVTIVPALISPLYKQEALRFFSRGAELHILLAKASHETVLNEKLAKDKVISPKEMFDIRLQEQKIISENETFRRGQFADWQADLVKYKAELNQCISRQEELTQLFETDRIRAPVSGYLQELSRHYPGNSMQAGELICSISPGGLLMGECYVSSKDIGMLKTGQTARFQIDAFNYNYFGAATGNIFSIDNDFILMDKTPVYKVKCRLNESMLRLSNGYAGELKKGMSFQARFITCHRTLWQLLFDTVENWLNPVHPPI
jgi:multidrug efflux pump subunit AcrA (membrane-fusion protein)